MLRVLEIVELDEVGGGIMNESIESLSMTSGTFSKVKTLLCLEDWFKLLLLVLLLSEELPLRGISECCD